MQKMIWIPSESAGANSETPNHAFAQGAISSTTLELILRRASVWKVSKLLFNTEFRGLQRRTFLAPGMPSCSTS
jgi:hypothetical protein